MRILIGIEFQTTGKLKRTDKKKSGIYFESVKIITVPGAIIMDIAIYTKHLEYMCR